MNISFLSFFPPKLQFLISPSSNPLKALCPRSQQSLDSVLKSQSLTLPTVILKSWNTKFSEKSNNPTTGSQVSESCQQEVKSQIPHLQMCKFYSVSKGKSYGCRARRRFTVWQTGSEGKEMPESTISRGNSPPGSQSPHCLFVGHSVHEAGTKLKSLALLAGLFQSLLLLRDVQLSSEGTFLNH